MRLLDPLFSTDKMREVFSPLRTLQGMLDFEAALARALVATGHAPASVLGPIQQNCKAELYSAEAIAREAASAGNLAIPLLKLLTTAVENADQRAGAFVHLGATSQDAIDTGAVLQIRAGLTLLDAALVKLADRLATLAEENQSTILPGRTWMQQASPVTLGLKFAGWLDAINRHRARVAQAHSQVGFLQFGGAVGTLAALGSSGPAVAAALARELHLALPPVPWHAHRDRITHVAATLGLLVGTLGKIARDISLMSQSEVAEAFESGAPGRGGSSTMPHKRNSVGSAVILSAAIRVPPLVSTMLTALVQEHERGLGGWHAEWETLPEIFLLTDGALHHLSGIVDGLQIDREAMARNMAGANGLALSEAVAVALTKVIGREAAHQSVASAARVAPESKLSLREALLKDPRVTSHLAAAEIDKLLDPKNYLGSAQAMTRQVLAEHKKTRL
jgi:3-carboxy-cis,cis-muconate cycloisomerase